MTQFKYNKFKQDLQSIQDELNKNLLNHNFIKNKRCNINIANEDNEEIVRKILSGYGYTLVKQRYTHPEYQVRCIDYYVVG